MAVRPQPDTIRLLADHGVPVTAVGNHMLVTCAAYAASGGYEALAFGVSEDLQLFGQVVAWGWQFRNLVPPQALPISLPQPTLAHLLRQRQRWMNGAARLPWQLGALVGAYGAFIRCWAGRATTL